MHIRHARHERAALLLSYPAPGDVISRLWLPSSGLLTLLLLAFFYAHGDRQAFQPSSLDYRNNIYAGTPTVPHGFLHTIFFFVRGDLRRHVDGWSSPVDTRFFVFLYAEALHIPLDRIPSLNMLVEVLPFRLSSHELIVFVLINTVVVIDGTVSELDSQCLALSVITNPRDICRSHFFHPFSHLNIYL